MKILRCVIAVLFFLGAIVASYKIGTWKSEVNVRSKYFAINYLYIKGIGEERFDLDMLDKDLIRKAYIDVEFLQSRRWLGIFYRNSNELIDFWGEAQNYLNERAIDFEE